MHMSVCVCECASVCVCVSIILCRQIHTWFMAHYMLIRSCVYSMAHMPTVHALCWCVVCTCWLIPVYMWWCIDGSVLLTHRTPGSEVKAACDFLLSHQMEDGEDSL